MKQILYLVLALLVVACSGSPEDKASHLLSEARENVEKECFDEARDLIDSLREYYPTAAEARRGALQLENELEMKAAKKELGLTDSMLCVESERLDSMKQHFVLEKDPEYQLVGYYVVPEQIGSKMHKTALRAQVNEEGEMVLISVVHGRQLNHKTISVASSDGEMVTTPDCFSFLTHSVVGYEEEASYKLGEDGGVIAFIANNPGTMTVTCNGKSKPYSFQLSPSDKFAVRHCYLLARKFDSVKRLREQQEKLALKVRFYEKKMTL
jgi:hypothetical protein